MHSCTNGSRARPPRVADADVDSVAFYDRNARRFAAETGNLDMSAFYDRFLRHIQPAGRILDAGCGIGRDARAFIERGYSVVAFDASTEMVRLAGERAGGRAEVLQLRFEDLAWREEFDGIWACASLLHIPTVELPAIAARLAIALRPGGILYMSFKYGLGERVAGGRRFANQTEETLTVAVGGTNLVLVEIWTTNDLRVALPGERWLNAIATRAR